MDSKERHIRENENLEKREAREAEETRMPDDMIANSMKAKGRERKRENTKRINNLWLWFGVLILVAILLYWLFSIGIFESLTGFFNG